MDINDLVMAGKPIAWLVLEVIIGTENLRYKYVGIFSDNTAAVLWTQRGAAKKVRSIRTSAYSLSFGAMSGKSVTVSFCACRMRSECAW